jgi:DNA polymerase III subunit delta'
MPLAPLIGHESARARLDAACRRDALPASLLLHGPRGIGKQRLALWLGQRLLCEAPTAEPCGHCAACRLVINLQHPDLIWVFPVERDRLSGSGANDALALVRQLAPARAGDDGCWSASLGTDAIYLELTTAISRAAAQRPAMAKRTVVVIGDAERLVPQASSQEAANAILKLLEEPPATLTLVLTSSEPGLLLPTIRSRVASIRVAPLTREQLAAWAAQPAVAARLGRSVELDSAAGSPGRLLSGARGDDSARAAIRWLDASSGKPADRFHSVLAAKTAGARGAFSDALDALEDELRAELRHSVRSGDGSALVVAGLGDTIDTVRELAERNVNPALLTASLLTALSRKGSAR